LSFSSEIDATPFVFPITVTGWFKASWPPKFKTARVEQFRVFEYTLISAGHGIVGGICIWCLGFVANRICVVSMRIHGVKNMAY
jgi:hypothetical protein